MGILLLFCSPPPSPPVEFFIIFYLNFKLQADFNFINKSSLSVVVPLDNNGQYIIRKSFFLCLFKSIFEEGKDSLHSSRADLLCCQQGCKLCPCGNLMCMTFEKGTILSMSKCSSLMSEASARNKGSSSFSCCKIVGGSSLVTTLKQTSSSSCG